MTTERQPTGRKWGTRREPYTRLERARCWLRNVWHAVTEVPPTYVVIDVLYMPGDTGYDEAPLTEYLDTQPLRFDGAEGERTQL